ncbi:MAG: hypothetical protein K8F91_16210, partial [Candidatus Obscuribacterales bacterium]|nr:hypothetical protein [Candidatus Obscuribacterales bacterium]
MNSLDAYITGVSLIAPEIVVVVAILLSSVWDLFAPRKKAVTPWFGLTAMAGAFLLFITQLKVSETIFGGLYTVDALTVTFGLIACVVGFIVILMTMGYEHHFKNNRGEFYAILLTAIVAVMFL